MSNTKVFIDKLHNEKLCQFLIIRGWKELPCLFNGTVRQFLTPEGDDAILLPLSRKFSDYYSVMENSLKTIALNEKVTINGLYNILINPSSDIIKWRIADDNTSLGIISFNAMSDNIENIKNMLASTCLNILNPASFHTKLLTNPVQEQVATYRFGQTEVGSYILNLVSPLGFYQYQLFDPCVEELPMNRRINLKMLNDINIIERSIQENSSELDDNISRGNISVNFLTSLAKLYDDNSDSQVTINAAWDSNVPTIVENPISTISLHPKCVDKVSQMAEKYTPQKEQNLHKIFYGKIVNISGAAEVDNREVLLITLATIGEEGQKISVKVELNNQSYSHIVTDAFEQGANVKVEGTSSFVARSLKLLNASIEKLD